MLIESNKTDIHDPVLLEEVIDYLQIKKLAHLKDKAKVIDATVGTAGHSLEILKYPISVLGIDTDKKMLEIAREKFEMTRPAMNNSVHGHFKLVYGNFKDLKVIAEQNNFINVDAILFDLGTNVLHFKDVSRGFSFTVPEADLDMRLDQDVNAVRARDLLNALREDQLIDLFSKVLDLRLTRSLSREIIDYRHKKPIYTVGDFLEIIKRSNVYYENKDKGTHWATTPFLALRIATNSELSNLNEGMSQAVELLKPGGRMAIISFHSLEDAVVKSFIKKLEDENIVINVTKKPIKPSEEEIKNNPRARSSKLRVAEKL